MTHLIPFHPTSILLPTAPTSAWPVVACDQYTSEPPYWAEVERIVGDAPSTLRITLPEIYLKEDPSQRIQEINQKMQEYLQGNMLQEFPDAMILVKRTLADGRVRWGIVGAIDLADYDHKPGEKPLIRATEGTVLERIPPRVAIRRDAMLELPHVMLLLDDPEKTVIEPIAQSLADPPLYDLPLMQGGGRIQGYLLHATAQDRILEAMSSLLSGEHPMLFAVGDGNHSLATAKACAALRPDNPLAAQALVEVVNIHDPALDFEPIYRVLFGVDPIDVAKAAKEFFPQAGQAVTILAGDTEQIVYAQGLVSQSVQDFIDGYLATHPEAEVDYIHGEDVVRNLASRERTVGFLFPGIGKSELFPYVRAHGALPRKTFSMGEAQDKRFYMEARKIR